MKPAVVDTDMLEPIVVRTATVRGFERVRGFAVPETAGMMAIYESNKGTWSITHRPTGRWLLWVCRQRQALHLATVFYDAATLEGISLDCSDPEDERRWSRWFEAIARHVPKQVLDRERARCPQPEEVTEAPAPATNVHRPNGCSAEPVPIAAARRA